MRLTWSRRRGWIALGIAGLCTFILGFLVTSTAIDTGKSPLAAAFLFFIGLAAALAALFATEGAPLDARHWTAWLKPRPISVVFLAIFAGFGVMTNALALFAPRPAVERAPHAIENGIDRVETKLDAIAAPKAEAPPRIRRVLAGLWGEPGCAVTYRFGLDRDLIAIDSVLRPPGTLSWHSEASVLTARGDVIEARMERPERGGSITFTYRTNGRTERLLWHDQRRAVPLELDRCR